MLEKLFLDWVADAQNHHLPIEGIAVADTEQIILEHHFTPDLPRNIYSHTKSYMVTAVGIAIDEGKLNLNDRVVDFFPQDVPETHDPRLEKITLRHLLTMSSGMNHPYLMGADRRSGVGQPDYIAYWMGLPVEEDPGKRFVYSSADSIIAGRMVEQVTGMRLGAYLYEKVFSRMEQGWPIWECDAEGHPVGCGGMYMTLSNMMKLGQLYLAGGRWKGEPIVSEGWVKAAGSKQIETGPSNDPWICGYGYQFWCSPYPGAYRADGAYGQITTILPEQGLVIAIQCPEKGDLPAVKKALHENFLQLL